MYDTHDLKSGDKLAEDTNAESTAITSYPNGISIMPVSAVADWFDIGENASIVTEYTENGARQWLIGESGSHYFRFWADDEWQQWDEPASFTTIEQAISTHALTTTHKYIRPFAEDTYTESTAVTSYFDGFSTMPASAGANWGPNTGEAGHVLTERNGSTGRQTFAVPATGTSYVRYYTGGAWGSWSSGGLLRLTHQPTPTAQTIYRTPRRVRRV